VHGKNPRSIRWANRPPTPGISPKWFIGNFYITILTFLDKEDQFYISKNELKLTNSNVEFQKFSQGDAPEPCFKGKEREERVSE